MTSLILRPYQDEALKQIRKHYSVGIKKILLHMATGSGKTVIFSTVMKGIHAKGNRCVLAVRGRELVDNASQRLLREGVPHGVMMANHWNYNPSMPIQVCSIDTLTARKNKMRLPDANLVVIDEAHFAISNSFRWFIEEYKNRGALFLSVTATPHVKEGLRFLADIVVYPITIGKLIEQGFLVPPRYFAPPNGIDFKKIKVDSRTGDYNVKDLAEEVGKAKLSGDIITHYMRHAHGRPAILFACDIAHSKTIVSELLSAGIPSLHIDADSSDEERKTAMRRLENGEIKIVSNVGIFCTGVDIPCASAIILARPTKSYNLFIQQIGRGTRPYQNKTDFIVLDHANNINEHGIIEYEKECELDGCTIVPKKVRTITCKKCYHVFEFSGTYICDLCGFDNLQKESEGKEITVSKDVKLEEIKSKESLKDLRIKKFIDRSIYLAFSRGYKPMWIFYQIKEKYGEDFAKQKWPQIQQRIFPS